jgi:4-diphosphocytidyl-2-C-methyl-D-erythritol kinase
MLIQAPAKLNLCLYLGEKREDGLHELLSLFEPLTLADEILVSAGDWPATRARPARDEVFCAGVEGDPADNLGTRALDALRLRGWRAPSLRVEIEKRIPVAAGLGGGSADAAAMLRLVGEPLGERRWRQMNWTPDLVEIAAELGADIPSQLVPALSVVRGAGERVVRLPDPEPHAVVLLPDGGGLSTADVFAEADRLGLGRPTGELDELSRRLHKAAGAGASPLDYPDLLVNDLEPAARSLRPGIGTALDELRAAGAPLALLTGSGPTAFGLFADLAAAKEAAARLDRDDAIVCEAGRVP